MRKPRPREEGWVRVSWGAGQGHLGLASGSLACTEAHLADQGSWGVFSPFRAPVSLSGSGGLGEAVSEDPSETWATPTGVRGTRPGAPGPHLASVLHLCLPAPLPPRAPCAGTSTRSSPGPRAPAACPQHTALPRRGVSDPSTGHCTAPAVRPGCCASSIFQHQPMKDSQAAPFTGGTGLCTCGAPTARSEHTGRGQLCPST